MIQKPPPTTSAPHQQEQPNRGAVEHAKEQVRLRDRFLAVLAHELRNPLSAILNATYLIDRPEADRATISQASELIKRQAGHLSRLLEDLLDVSGAIEGKMRLKQGVVSLNTIVQDAVQTMRPAIEKKRHQLLVDAPGGELHVHADPSRLQQVFINLLSNAARFTPPNGRLQVIIEQEGSEAVVHVRDNGAGIPADQLDDIFDLFIQGSESPEQGDCGLGVGLTLVRALAQLHGGSVTALSDGVGQGSEFVVRLPLAKARKPSRRASSAQTHPNAGVRVLLVEDEPDNRTMLEAVLQLEGYEVATAADGPEALRKFGELRPDVVLCDLKLPYMSGLEVARQMRKRADSKELLLIALTGYGRSTDRRASKRAGFDAHLLKPLNPDDLLAELKRRKPR